MLLILRSWLVQLHVQFVCEMLGKTAVYLIVALEMLGILGVSLLIAIYC